jgi:hypothetical protein
MVLQLVLFNLSLARPIRPISPHHTLSFSQGNMPKLSDHLSHHRVKMTVDVEVRAKHRGFDKNLVRLLVDAPPPNNIMPIGAILSRAPKSETIIVTPLPANNSIR